MKSIITCLIILMIGASCNTVDIYEKTFAFSSHTWSSREAPVFTFDIKDTSSLYNFYVVLRHEDAYRYKNIWLNLRVQDPYSFYTIRREFILANSSKWLGSSMDDIIEHRMVINNEPIPLKKGVYTFTLQEDMREDPLQYVLNAGIRIEKVHP